MAVTVQEIQDRLASALDNASSATSGSNDWNLRMVMLRRAEAEWSEFYDWKVLYKEYNFIATTNYTLAMPSDFRKLAGYPRITYDLSTTADFEEIPVETKTFYPEEHNWFYLIGSPQGGYNMIMSRSIASGASVHIPYFSMGATLATTTSVSNCPNPEYLVERVRSLWLDARDDPKATDSANKAESIKAQMLERELTFSPAQSGQVLNTTQKRGFKLGRD